MIIDGFKISNYKCFADERQGFDKVFPMNIIIGRNNTGKSSLIDLVKYAVDGDLGLINLHRNNVKVEITFRHTISPADEMAIYPQAIQLREIIREVSFDVHMSSETPIKTSKFSIELPQGHKENLTRNYPPPLYGKVFKRITAERDIAQEAAYNVIKLSHDGKGCTNLIQMLLHNTKYEPRTINRTLLKELNTVLNPEIRFTDIATRTDDNGIWEIYFEDGENGFIPLSKMGSGIKTVLLVLLNLLIIPQVDNKEKSNYVFAFEELENNLHPSLLRRLFSYIKKYSEENKAYFFITTHSSIVIDLFSNYEHAQILHVTTDGEKSVCSNVSTFLDHKKILKDLDVRASDLLQSNGIVWVEGPSDRVYINKWLSLMAPELQEGLHYSVLFYGGRLLANLTFDYEWLASELIPLLKINLNAFVVMDRDGKSEDAKLNETKQRIEKEIGADNCWVTKGREIENYLLNNTINNWLEKEHKIAATINNEINTKLGDNIVNADKSIELEYDKNKKGYSMEIVDFITAEDINSLDLKEKLGLLIRQIKLWNSL